MTMKLLPGEIHLWHADSSVCGGDPCLDACLEWLDETEQRRLARYQLARHRQRYLLGRTLIRKTLSRYTGLEPGRWQLTQNRYGKPYVVDGQWDAPLYFNLSHSGNAMVLAVAGHEMLGVDVERADRPRRVAKIAHRFFSETEVEALMNLEDSARLARFYSLWTLKEATIKARGMGLTLSLKDFSFAFPGAGEIIVAFSGSIEDQPSSWQFWHWHSLPEQQLALAVKAPGAPGLAIRHWRLDGLDQFTPMTLAGGRQKLP